MDSQTQINKLNSIEAQQNQPEKRGDNDTQQVCDLSNDVKERNQRLKSFEDQDAKLDSELLDTFPSSDPITHY
eukprot:TRINITY_DN6893_c0_g1_i1.p1 TRINITY_DN6893_c0_g1~~TRINITY_DN6893_c0_g1_i1.p1  ORF type:complete len:73 (-),score=21.08 TRINITY_DN6893_c0_g1_i1:72-290(-)